MKKILIIEDDEKLALALCVRLKANGYAIWVAGDAIRGLSTAVREKPDLILLDVSLPAGNGLALAERFRQVPETRRIPVIFGTGSEDPALRDRALALGAAGLIRKPYEAETLLTIIRHALGGREAGGASALPMAGGANSEVKKSRKTILIVEDDQRIATAITLRMKAAGFDTAVAGDAISAVHLALQIQPDAVLLDVSLPAGDGFTVAQRIQANIPKPTPIVFLTASKRPGFREKARQLGAVGFLEKPYEPEALLAVVHRAVVEPAAQLR